MHNIDTMVGEIERQEAIALEGCLDEKRRQKIESQIIEKIVSEAGENRYAGYRISRRKHFIFILVAVLLIAMGLTAYAVVENRWDNILLKHMGLTDGEELQLESGEVNLQKSAVCLCDGEEIQVMAKSSIGDKNSAYIRLETNIIVPEDFDEMEDYYLFEDLEIVIYDDNPRKGGKMLSGASSFTAIYDEGKIDFLLFLSGYENLNKAYVTLKMKDIYWCPDGIEENREIIYEGLWELEWEYNYKSSTQTHRMLKKVDIEGVPFYLTKVEVSPIGIKVKAFCMPWNRNKVGVGGPENYIESIQYKDESLVEISGYSSAGCSNGMFYDFFIDILNIGEVIEVDEVDGIIIADEEILLK